MKAVRRFEPEKGFRLATYAIWWIRASIQEYVLRSWSLVKMGTTANQKKLFFNLRKAKNEISAFEEGDLPPDQVKLIAELTALLRIAEIEHNRRLEGFSQVQLAPLIREVAISTTRSPKTDVSPFGSTLNMRQARAATAIFFSRPSPIWSTTP